MNYDTMPAGQDLDELVGKALGYTYIDFPDGACPHVKHWSRPDGTFCGMIPQFSESIAHAWEVVEKMRDKGHYVNACQRQKVCWCEVVDYDGMPLYRVKAKTAPLAICRAALRALA
jgi:Phage ABA sandwich domain